MRACGLIVEYNPLHNGHVYHIQSAKEVSKADCMIAVMSGPFLQRGEPAIIDKFHRTKAALANGVDIVLELPYPYAVQSSKNFAKGAVRTLHEIGISSICFGSESGLITDFTANYHLFKENETIYTKTLRDHLNLGLSFPRASMLAHEKIGLASGQIDLSQPNNILGFSYVREILDHELAIEPLTIKRQNNDYHEQTITNSISSATSIRKQLVESDKLSEEVIGTMPHESVEQLIEYKQKTDTWHHWENYFPLIHYRVQTMSIQELTEIHGVDEGLEYRIKETSKLVTSFKQWMEAVKTKRYTWTRLQRIFVHILTNTKKSDMQEFNHKKSVPYIRLLGFTDTGRKYLNENKKKMNIPIVTQFSGNHYEMMEIDERASNAYYRIIQPSKSLQLQKQEIEPPILY